MSRKFVSLSSRRCVMCLLVLMLIGVVPVYAFETVYVNPPNVSHGYGYTDSSEMNSTSGTDMRFKTLYKLDIGNPQSIAVNPEGTIAWIMSTGSGSDNKRLGRVCRVDLATGEIVYGPTIVTGHGQTLSYNPVTEELWYVRETKIEKSTLVKVNPDTGTIEREVSFTMDCPVPPTFCFDGDGNAWMYTRSEGSKQFPKGSVRLYKGYVSDSGANFTMLNRGLSCPPGPTCQSIAYNPNTDRLYIIGDSAMFTVPIERIENLTGGDVETIEFAGSGREFEGMAFSELGTAYFLTNKPVQIMRDEKGYEFEQSERKRIQEELKQLERDEATLVEMKEDAIQSIVNDEIEERMVNS